MMMSTGSNTLRGGVHSYRPCTLTSNWAEDRLTREGREVVGMGVSVGATSGRGPARSERQIRDMEATGRTGASASVLSLTASPSAAWLSAPVPAVGTHTLTHAREEVKDATARFAATAAARAGGMETTRSAGTRSAAPRHFDRIEDRFDYENVINPDRLYPPQTWASMTASTHFGAQGGSHLDVDEFKSGYTLGGGDIVRDPEELARYRQRWINDPEPGVSTMRFTAEAARAYGAATAERYRSEAVRTLPGVVKCVEVVRDKACEAHGTHGVWMVARLTPAEVTLPQLHKALATAGVHLSVDEGKELWRDLDPMNVGVAEGRKLVQMLLAKSVAAVRADAVRLAWNVLEHVCRGKVTLADILRYYDPANALHPHPDVKRRIDTPTTAKQHLQELFEYVLAGEPDAPTVVVLQREAAAAAAAAAAATVGEAIAHGAHIHRVPKIADPATVAVTADAFVRVHHFLSMAVNHDSEFANMLAASWHLEDAAYVLGPSQADTVEVVLRTGGVASLPVRSVTVLATHGDGRKTLQKIPQDRFLNADDTAALLERLHAQGVSDVVSVVRNF